MKMNLPNIMTLARLAMLPVVLFLIWPGVETRETAFWSSMAYIFAGIFDVVDGALARYMNQVTAFGKFLDPLADKLFYLVTLLGLLQLPGPWVPPWVVMVILSRELAITGLRGIAVTEGIVIAAGEGGKVKTTFGTAGIAALLIHYPYVVDVGFTTFVLDCYRLGLWLTYVSVAFSILSAIGYIRGFVRALKIKPVPVA
jgi:CDP-diacylglycerol--glycerol-3-phosphate 3-phosphatidyltransferase